VRGFTLVELIIVVLIVGIVVALGYPALTGSVVDARLYAATSAVATAFEFAQLSAAASGRPCRVTVNVAAETVAIEQLAYTNIADILDPAVTEIEEDDIESATVYAAMEDPMKRGSDYVVDFSSSDWFGGVDLSTAAFGTGNTVVFNERGTPSEGGQVALTCGGREVAIAVDALTGKVTLSE
jgi:prepilin-type N-terminal cleavage/methylation domain-containing protein